MNDRLRAVWREMKRRCQSPKDPSYERYGARGITVCAEWLDYVTFERWALENGYRLGLTIERVNNDGAYEPSNCTWIPPGEQARNRRNNHMVTAFGKTKCMRDWSRDERCSVDYRALHLRITRRGWDAERAIQTPAIKNNAEATHCPQGHPYTPDNTNVNSRGWRKCKICMRERARVRYAARVH